MGIEHERRSELIAEGDHVALRRLMLIALAASLLLVPLLQGLRSAEKTRRGHAERIAVALCVVVNTLSAGLLEMSAAQFGMLVLAIAFAVGFPLLIMYAILGLIRSNRTRNRSSGGVSGFLLELDRLVRPSIQHVEQVNDEAPEGERIDGE